MKTSINYICAGLLILATSQAVNAVTLTFEGLPLDTPVGEQYASLGVHFTLTDYGVKEGLANGDSGNWGLNGTAGPFFEGFNGLAPSGDGYSMTLTFDAPVTSFALDASRSNGSMAGDTFTVSGFLGVTLVETRTVVFGAINSWTTIPLPGIFDRVQWSGQGPDFHPYGVDNINFTVVPEPSTFALFVGASLVAIGRRRIHGSRAA